MNRIVASVLKPYSVFHFCVAQALVRFSFPCRRRSSARRSAGLKAGRYTDVESALALRFRSPEGLRHYGHV